MRWGHLHDNLDVEENTFFFRPLILVCRAKYQGGAYLRHGGVTSSNVLRKGSLQTKLNAGLSEQQQEDLFQNERSFHEVKLLTIRA